MAQVAQKPMKTTASVKPTLVKETSAKGESAARESVRFVPISRKKLMDLLAATREQDQPVLDYLQDK